MFQWETLILAITWMPLDMNHLSKRCWGKEHPLRHLRLDSLCWSDLSETSHECSIGLGAGIWGPGRCLKLFVMSSGHFWAVFLHVCRPHSHAGGALPSGSEQCTCTNVPIDIYSVKVNCNIYSFSDEYSNNVHSLYFIFVATMIDDITN